MSHRFGAVVCQNIVPGAFGGQDVQDTVEQAAGITPRLADVWLRRREVLPGNFPEIVVNSPEGHTPEYYLRAHIYFGRPR